MSHDPSTLIDTSELAEAQAAGINKAGRADAIPETEIFWSTTEGQVVNTGAFIVAILLCWLVLPVFWAIFRYLRTANHQYVLTDQRLLERSGIIVKKVETLELYRVKDLSISSTLLQTLFGRGQVILHTTDTTSPTLLVNALPSPEYVSQIMRNRVEQCREARGVRAFDQGLLTQTM